MTALTARQVNFYQQNGYLAPIDIFTEDEASRSRRTVCRHNWNC